MLGVVFTARFMSARLSWEDYSGGQKYIRRVIVLLLIKYYDLGCKLQLKRAFS